jgi:hypothetical protein
VLEAKSDTAVIGENEIQAFPFDAGEAQASLALPPTELAAYSVGARTALTIHPNTLIDCIQYSWNFPI